MEYGGPRTSSTAHGVIAVKEWILPPDVGYKTEVWHGALKTWSAFNFASLAAKPPYSGKKKIREIPNHSSFLDWREKGDLEIHSR